MGPYSRERGSSFGQAHEKLSVADYDCKEYRSGDLLSDLLHAASHEIGNPLTSIISLATIIERIVAEGGDERGSAELRNSQQLAKIRDYANSILREAWRVSSISQDVVAILSNRTFHPCSTDLETILRQSIQRLRKTLSADLLCVESFFEKGCREVAMEADQLKVLLTCMLRKAYLLGRGKISSVVGSSQASIEGPLTVKLEVADEGANVEISVSVVCREATEQFGFRGVSFRPIAEAHEEGKMFLNLELAACWAIVQRFHGSLKVQELGRPDGYLVAIRALLPKPPLEPSQLNDSRQVPEQLKILLVNTEEMVSNAIRRILMLSFRECHSVECANSSWLEFIDKSEARRGYDVIICDLGNGANKMLGDYLCSLKDETETMNRLGFLVDGSLPSDISSLQRPVIQKPFEIDELCSFVLALCE